MQICLIFVPFQCGEKKTVVVAAEDNKDSYLIYKLFISGL